MRPLEIVYYLSVLIYRRQILTSIVNPFAVRIKFTLLEEIIHNLYEQHEGLKTNILEKYIFVFVLLLIPHFSILWKEF